MDVNGNVSDEKKTWWQMHRLKILIAIVLLVGFIIFFIWFTIKTNTTLSQNSIRMMKKKFLFLNFSSFKLVNVVTKRSLSGFMFDSLTYFSRRSSYSEYFFSRSRFVQLSLFINGSRSMVSDAYRCR